MNLKLTLKETGDVLDFNTVAIAEIRELLNLLLERKVNFQKMEVDLTNPVAVSPKRKQFRQRRNEKFPNACKPWSAADIDDLRDGLGMGLLPVQLAKNLGRTLASIEAKIHDLKVRGLLNR